MAASPAAYAQYDLFITYAEVNQRWVTEFLIPRLRLPRERVITASDFISGESKVSEFERAVTTSHYVLIVWSQAYALSPWAKFAERLATYEAISSGRNRPVTLTLDSTKVPLHLNVDIQVNCQDAAQWESEIAAFCRQHLDPPPPVTTERPCPYRGMRQYGEAEAEYFFGRKDETDALVSRLEGQRLVVVIGNSGCGKSSLVRAGVMPRLRKSRRWRWEIRTMRPGAVPISSLATALGCEAPPGDWQAQAGTLLGGQPEARLLVVVDQFEEAFAVAEASPRAEFLAALSSLRSLPNCALLILLRADFYGWLLSNPLPLGELHDGDKMDLLPPSGEALRQAISKPAAAAGVYVEERLLDALEADCGHEPEFLPMLQETLAQLWDRAEGSVLTYSAYMAMGGGKPGISEAMTLAGNRAMSELTTDAPRRIAWRVLIRLVQFGENRANTRRQQPVRALGSLDDQAPQFRAVLEALERNRLIVITEALDPTGRLVDLSHEGLIEGWPSLRQYADKWKPPEMERRMLCQKAEEWIRLGSGATALLDRVQVQEAERWLKSEAAQELGVPEHLKSFVEASRRQLTWLQRSKILMRAGIAALLLLFVASAAVAWEYIQSVRLSDEAMDTLIQPDDPAQNLIALGKALDASTHWKTTRALTAMQYASHNLESDGILQVAGNPRDLVVGANGLLAAAGSDGEVGLYDLKAGKPRPSLHPREQVRINGVAIDPRSGQVAAAAGNGKVILWDAGGEKDLPDLSGAGQPLWRLAFSHNGKWLATGSEDGTIAIWDTDSKAPTRIAGQGRITQLAFSPDDAWLASASTFDRGSGNYAATLWKVGVAQPRRVFAGHARPVTGIVFEPDSKHLVTVSEDGMLRFWSVDSDSPTRVVPVEKGLDRNPINRAALSSVAISAAGDVLAVGHAAAKAQLWDPKTGSRKADLLGMRGRVWAMAFSNIRGKCLYIASDSPGADGGTIHEYVLEKDRLIQSARQLQARESQ